MPSFGILTSSDKASTHERQDLSGERIRSLLTAIGFIEIRYKVLPDEQHLLEECLRSWVDEERLDLIVTTGGTGLTDRDVIPEATLAVIDRQVPGMAEAMHIKTLNHTPLAMISRSVVGVRGRTLIINLPGNPKAVEQCLAVVIPVIPHALEMLQESPPSHNSP
ncbi:MAG: molybdenum cofactor biosynthesis protein [SAR202 cluster bacterium Io17-Chloro-G3]|nr:MAG: molybdenum cofactor biosynthesis protein [SAR202 cluster bacterium Io17-Chloro-G3]